MVQVRFDDGFFVRLAPNDDNDNVLNLGSFGCYILRPYRNWMNGSGNFDFRERWQLFAGLFGTPEQGILF